MSCRKCGRDDGHWIGCAEVLREHARNLVEPDFAGSLCSFDGCSEPRRSEDKRVKFCAKHSDPKNRK
jgi:hypothetical protein